MLNKKTHETNSRYFHDGNTGRHLKSPLSNEDVVFLLKTYEPNVPVGGMYVTHADAAKHFGVTEGAVRLIRYGLRRKPMYDRVKAGEFNDFDVEAHIML